MIELWYVDGELQETPAEVRGMHVFRVSKSLPPLLEMVKLSRRERRRRARRWSGIGRRKARPVHRRSMRDTTPVKVVAYLGHLLSDGRREAKLFLLDGERPTPEMCRDVDRWLRRRARERVS